jgi:hypothetical protein
MVPVEISRVDESLLKERAFTENVSPRGARVVTKRAWQLGADVLVVSSQDGVRLRARIVYCQAMGIGRFVIGLKLSASAGEWRRPTRRA